MLQLDVMRTPHAREATRYTVTGGPPRVSGVAGKRWPGVDQSSPENKSGQVAQDGEAQLVASLRRGDEAAFMRLVERYQAAMVRLAQSYTRDLAVAEEVAQEAWVSALTHLDQFAGRSSFKTWLFHILVNGARARAARERRSVPFSALETDDDAGDGPEGPSVAPERFGLEGSGHPGGWLTAPQSWEHAPEARLASREMRERILAAIAALPVNQRSVIRLRDVEGYPANEVSAILGISDVNQRVLLHRARSRVRQALEDYFAEE
jgi:RNA polymerase sigma-70 factor, ECF subfamily